MRLAILSDIHANLEALTKSIELIDKAGADKILCLGDVVGYGANPNECLDIVRKRCAVTLLGNHDAAAVDLAVSDRFTTNARLSAVWTHKSLGKEHKDFLASLPVIHEQEDVLCVHASPCDPEAWDYVMTDDDARSAFTCYAQDLCFIGHTHMPVVFTENGKAREVQRGNRFIINVGSVGQPRDGNPKLSFGVFDTATWKYENIRSEYDIQRAAEKIIKAGLPRGLGDRLAMGI